MGFRTGTFFHVCIRINKEKKCFFSVKLLQLLKKSKIAWLRNLAMTHKASLNHTSSALFVNIKKLLLDDVLIIAK